jgi:hypothetical protein
MIYRTIDHVSGNFASHKKRTVQVCFYNSFPLHYGHFYCGAPVPPYEEAIPVNSCIIHQTVYAAEFTYYLPNGLGHRIWVRYINAKPEYRATGLSQSRHELVQPSAVDVKSSNLCTFGAHPLA